MKRWSMCWVVAGLGSWVAACNSYEDRRVQVGPERVLCESLVATTCLLVTDLDRPEDGATYHYEGIRGFTHVWGQTTELDVEIEHVSDPPLDGSSEIWRAERVALVDVAPPGRTFELRVPRSGWEWIRRAAPDRLVLVDGTPITCEAAACDAAVAATATETVDLTLAYTNGPLELRAVTPAPP